MALVDHELQRYLSKGLLENYDPALINPASIDLRLGNTIFIERHKPFAFIRLFSHLVKQRFTKTLPTKQVLEALFYWQSIDISDRTEYRPYLIFGKAFILGDTQELFNIPSNLTGDFRMKSSRAREGFNNCLAVFCDPGWHGSVLTLEIINENRFRPLAIYPGLKIGQAIFDHCSIPEKDYSITGRYNNDKKVSASKG